jgi:uncharacterized protein (TIGR03067 family)
MSELIDRFALACVPSHLRLLDIAPTPCYKKSVSHLFDSVGVHLMRARYLTLLTVGLLLGADAPKADDAKKEMEKMKGTWVIASAEENGKPNDDAKGKKLEFTAGKIKLDDNSYPFKLDTSSKPKLIDVTVDKEVAEGIYTWDGDKLKICIHLPTGGVKARPTEFTTKDGSGDVLVVLERKVD